MPTISKIELDSSVIELLEPTLIHIVYKNEYEVELRDVKEVDQAFQELAGDKVVYVIMDTNEKFNTFSPEAQKYLSKGTTLVKKNQLGGFAVIINSLPYRIMVRFYMKMYKPNYKLKVFSKQDEAKVWFEKLKKES